jgi:hypothetical protein
MMASIIVERQGIALHASAQFSALRVVNGGAFGLLSALWGSYLHTWLPSICVALLFTVDLLLHLTSTVLVSDLGTGVLTSPQMPNTTVAAMSFGNGNLSLIADNAAQIYYWRNNFPSFPTFAEYREEANGVGNMSSAVRDTGVTLRAFLPYGSTAERTWIKDFNGTATVMDTRAVCVRPAVHDGLSLAFSQEYGWLLNGSMTPEVSPPGLILGQSPASSTDVKGLENGLTINIAPQNQKNQSVFLSWPGEIPYAHEAGEWNILQNLMYLGPTLISTLDTRYPELLGMNNSQIQSKPSQSPGEGAIYYSGDDQIPLLNGHSYQLLNMTVSANQPALINSSDPNGPTEFFFSVDQDLNKLIITLQEEWLVFTMPRLPDVTIATSLCFDSMVSADVAVTVSSASTLTEPALGAWDAPSQRFDTEAVRGQLGALPNTSDEARGILTLTTAPEDVRSQIMSWYDESLTNGWTNISYPAHNFVEISLRNQHVFGLVMCVGCGMELGRSGIVSDFIGDQEKSIFQDVMESTSNSALAWQAFYTALGRMAYYDQLAYFDFKDEPNVAWYRGKSTTAESPGLWRLSYPIY